MTNAFRDNKQKYKQCTTHITNMLSFTK